MANVRQQKRDAMSDDTKSNVENALERIQNELSQTSASTRRRIFEKFALAALGSIPWVGGFISAAVSIKTEERGIKKDALQTQWLEEHTKKMQRLVATLDEVAKRFDSLGDTIDERIQSESYLALVRQAFGTWDRAETEEKRKYVANLVTNASGTQLCSDDVVRLFIDWLDLYHEAHFAVIREIYQNPGSTRYDIWSSLRGEILREDSAEADLFKLLIRDLSTGGVIRQARETTSDGQFLRKRATRRSGHTPTTTESAFEDTKQYVLTELGKQFVHYTITEVVQRIGDK
jgi:hypothetical protein